eukprot:EG_transcript_33553
MGCGIQRQRFNRLKGFKGKCDEQREKHRIVLCGGIRSGDRALQMTGKQQGQRQVMGFCSCVGVFVGGVFLLLDVQNVKREDLVGVRHDDHRRAARRVGLHP